MMRARLSMTLALVASLLAPSVVAAQTVAIVGGKVYPVSAPPIDNGTVLIRDGRIVAVGASVTVPAGAQRIDAAGKIVTPGFVNGASRVCPISTDLGFNPSHGLKAAATRSRPFAIISRVAGTEPISSSPTRDEPFTKPGVTTLPVASMRCAPAGTVTDAPTATMRPSRMSTVPLSIGGALTG